MSDSGGGIGLGVARMLAPFGLLGPLRRSRRHTLKAVAGNDRAHGPQNPFGLPDRLGLLATGIGIATLLLFAVALHRADVTATCAAETAVSSRAPVVLAAPPADWGLEIHGAPLTEDARGEDVP